MEPRKLKEYRDKGRAAMKNKEFSIARRYFEMILQDNPDDQEAQKDLENLAILRAASWNFMKRLLVELNVRIMNSMGKAAKVIEDAEALSKSKPKSARLASLYGACAVKTGHFNDAAQALKTYANIKSDSVSAWKRYAYALEMAEDFKEATDAWARLRVMRPNNADFERKFKNISAQNYSKTSKIESLTDKRAKEEKEKLDRSDPAFIKQEAMKLKELADQRPEDKRAQLRFARKIAETGDNEMAIEAYEKVITLAPDDKKLLGEYANFLKTQRLWDKALEQYDIIHKDNPENIDIILEINRLKQEKIKELILHEGETEELKQQLDEFVSSEKEILIENTKKQIEKSPNDTDLLLQLSQLYMDQGNYDESIPYLQKASKVPQRMFAACKMLADCFRSKGLHEIAIEQYNKALTVAPKRPAGMDKRVKDIYYNLGDAYNSINNREKAIEYTKLLYEEDINYKDIKEKYEALYSKKEE